MKILLLTQNLYLNLFPIKKSFIKQLLTLLLLNATISIAGPAEINDPRTSDDIARRGQNFSFVPATGVSRYYAYIGSSIGARDIQALDLGLETSFKISDIPLGIDYVHVRLWSLINNSWASNSYVFRVRRPVYYPTSNGSVNLNSAQLWGGVWDHPIAYSDDITEIACNTLQSASVSSCLLNLNVNHRDAGQYNQEEMDQYNNAIGTLATGALTALTNIKLKAWAQDENTYCQLTLKVAQNKSQLMGSDYVDHIEVYGDQNWRLSGRRISYLTIPIPVDANGNFVIQINKEIQGACEVSIALNILGVNK